MGLWIRLAVLCAVLCVVVDFSTATEDEPNIVDVMNAANSKSQRQQQQQPQGYAPRRVRGGQRRQQQGMRLGGVRRPLRRGNGRMSRNRMAAAMRFRKNPYAHTRPQQQYRRPQQQRPQQQQQQQQTSQVQVPLPRIQQQQQPTTSRTQYGTVNLQQANGPSGQFQFAQTAPVKPIQLQHQQVKLTTRPSSTTNQKLSISMPTLANLLYKYAAKSSKPFFKANPYSMFGAGSYGPMPKPSGYTDQHRAQQTSYQRQPAPAPAQQVYRPAVQQQALSYQKPAAVQTYQPPATPATPVQVYRPPAPAPQQVYQQPPRQVYTPPVATQQQFPSPYQQPRYPGAAPAPNTTPAPANAPQPTLAPVAPRPSYANNKNTARSGYGTPVRQTYQYAQPRTVVQKSYAPAKPQAPTCPAAGNFCYGKKAGHYTHPGSQACFIQCDAFGRGYAKGCSPGTLWKPVGPEPALWNMCA